MPVRAHGFPNVSCCKGGSASKIWYSALSSCRLTSLTSATLGTTESQRHQATGTCCSIAVAQFSRCRRIVANPACAEVPLGDARGSCLSVYLRLLSCSERRKMPQKLRDSAPMNQNSSTSSGCAAERPSCRLPDYSDRRNVTPPSSFTMNPHPARC